MSATPSSSPLLIESWEVLDLLTSLVQKSLVVYEEDEQGQGRYHLLETVRQYAGERLLAAGEVATVRERHRDWFLALAEQAAPELHGPDWVAWRDRLEREHENLRAALAWTGARGQGEVSLRLSLALEAFWWMRSYIREGWEHLTGMLALPGAEGRTAARARALRFAGWLAFHQGDYGAARALHEESLAICRERGDKGGVADRLACLGEVACAQEEYGAARALHEESLAICRELGDKGDIADVLHFLGKATHEQGDYGAARARHEESLAIRRELGDQLGIANALCDLGRAAQAQGDDGAAQALLTEGEAAARGIADPRTRNGPLHGLGHLARELGDYGRAAALYRESLALRREINVPHAIAWALGDLAGLAARQGQAERAARLLGAAEALFQAIGASFPVAVRAEYERALATARSAPGAQVLAAAWAEGRSMSLEAAVQYALGDSDG